MGEAQQQRGKGRNTAFGQKKEKNAKALGLLKKLREKEEAKR